MVAFLRVVEISGVVWFVVIRAQQKKMKQHKEMIAAVRRGDRVLTGGGIIGTVTKVLGENELQVEIAENVRVKVARSTISEVVAKTQPVKGGGGGEAEGGGTEGKALAKRRGAK